MADGNSTLLNFIIGVDTEGESKLDRFKKKVDNLKKSVDNGADDMKNSFDSLRESMGVVSDEGDDMESSFMRATGQGLALLFAGRFLSQTFGGLSSRMNDLVGISDMMSGAIQSVLAPAFATLSGMVAPVVSWFIELDEGTKNLIGWFVILMTVMAPIIMIFGQLAAIAAAFNITLVALLGYIAAIIAPILAFIAAFRAGVVIVERFGNTVATIIMIFAALIAVIVGSPVVIAAALGLIIGAVWAMRDDIRDAIDTIINWFSELPDRLRDMASSMYEAARDVGSRIIDGISDMISENKDMIRGAINAILPPGVNLDTLEGAASTVGSGIDSVVNDFVIDDGRILKTHPNDVIMGTKNPDSLGGGGGDDIDIRIDNPTVSDDRDIDKIVREVERVLDRRSGGRGLTR